MPGQIYTNQIDFPSGKYTLAIQNFEGKTQTDVVVLDFSKAFDVAPTNASYTNSTTTEFGEQLLIGFKISWPIEPKK